MDNKNLLVSSKQLVGEKIRPTKIALVVSSLLLMNGAWAENVSMNINGKSNPPINGETKVYDNLNFGPESELTITNSNLSITTLTSENDSNKHSELKVHNSDLRIGKAHFNGLDLNVKSSLTDSQLSFDNITLENDAEIKSQESSLSHLSIGVLNLKGFITANGTEAKQGVFVSSRNQAINVNIGSITGDGQIFFSHHLDTSNVKNLDEMPNRTELHIDTIDVDYFQSTIIGYDLVRLNKVDIAENRLFLMNNVQDASLGSTTIKGHKDISMMMINNTQNMNIHDLYLENMKNDGVSQSLISGSSVNIKDNFQLKDAYINISNDSTLVVGKELLLDNSVFNSVNSNFTLNDIALKNNSHLTVDRGIDANNVLIDSSSNIKTNALTIQQKGAFYINNLVDQQQKIEIDQLLVSGSLDLKVDKKTQNIAELAMIDAINIDSKAQLNIYSDNFTTRDIINGSLNREMAIINITAKEGVYNNGVIAGSGIVNNLVSSKSGAIYVGNSAYNHLDNAPQFGHLYTKNYRGEIGSSLYFGFEMNGDESLADRLTITETSQGESKVYVHSVGEVQKWTTDKGIYLVDTSMIQDPEQKDQLMLSLGAKVSYGLYDYNLIKREQDDTQGIQAGWYLKESYKKEETIAPEANAYLANNIIANQMFTFSYKDRDYVNERGLWLHVGGSLGKFKSSLTNAIDSKMDYYTMRMGHDLWQNESITMGLMGAYGYVSGTTKNNYTHEKLDNKMHGFAVGLYGTYHVDENTYLDAWVQYVQTRNKIANSSQGHEKYDACGLMASIEFGKKYSLFDNLFITPQGQLTWMGIKSDTHRVDSGISYSSQRGNIQMRLGARLETRKGTIFNEGTPYLELNYIHNTRENRITMDHGPALGAHQIGLEGAKNVYQVKIGTDFSINNNARFGGEISHSFGKHSYRDTRLNLKFRYDF